MDKIRWYELPETRQLASLGKKLSKAAGQRLQWMLFYYFNGRNVARTCRHFGISRQTFYRWKRRFDRHDLTTLEGHSHRPRKVRQPTWTVELAERVLALRKQYPRWGKDKLVVLLRRENRIVSTSMVGRILANLKRRGALHEPPPAAILRRERRKLRNRPWAVRKPKYWRIEQPGDLVEIDTKELRLRRGVILKHFRRTRRGLPLGCGGSSWPSDFAGRRALHQHPARPLAVSSRRAAGGWWQRVRCGI
jgi:putative transposase